MTETILRRDEDVRLVPGVAQRASQLTRDHHVPAFGHWRARGHDRDALHGFSSSIGLTLTPR